MTYRLRLGGSAKRYLDRLEPRRRDALLALLEIIRADPLETGIGKPLHGKLSGVRSAQLGSFRILYEVFEGQAEIRVTDIGPRGDIYHR